MRRDLVLGGATLTVMIGALASLTRVFTDGTWRPATAAALLLALGVAAGARRVGFGAVASAIGSLVGLAVFTYVVHLPAGPLIPGPEQLGQAATLLGEGLVQFRDQPAPTAPLAGLILIITTAAWLVTHVTHELLVRWRHPGLALIPPAVLWIVPLAVPLPPGRTWPQALPFLAGAALVLLLESDADVAGHVSDRSGPRFSGAGVGVGAVALVIAAFLPGVLPGYGAQPWVDLAAGNDPRGLQPIVDVGDRLKLPEDRPVLEVRADRRTYLRIAALDTFDDNTWRLGPEGVETFRPTPDQLTSGSDPLPAEVPIAEQSEVLVNVEVLDLANIYVPVPYQPLQILGPERNRVVYSEVGGFVAAGRLEQIEVGGQSRSAVTAGFEYRVRAAVPSPSIDQLRSVAFDPADPAVRGGLQLNEPYERLAAEARRVYEEAGATTAVDRVFALQDWFTGPDSDFSYSTDVSVLRGSGALDTFLFDTKIGYCEYFATGMAVMLRATGIPARVAVGFLPGELTLPRDPGVGRTYDTYTVSTSDAHAWVEVLFPGYGWIKFDPTPRSDGATMQPRVGDLDPLQTERERELAALDQAPLPEEQTPVDPSTIPGEEDLPPGLENDQSAGGSGADGASSNPLRAFAVVLVLLTLGGVGVARYRDRSHHPELDPLERVLAAQRHLHTVARRHGVGRRPSETASALSRRWTDEGRTDAEIAERFAEIVQLAAFGGHVGGDAGVEAERLGDALSESLRSSVGRRERMLAPLRIPTENAADATRELLERFTTRR